MPKPKNKIEESKLLKALAELEDVTKGDPLEDADPEGGLSTEGTPLSDAAPSGRGEKTKKSRATSTSDDDDAAKAFSASDMTSSGDDCSSDEPPPPPFKKKGKKANAKSSAKKAMSRSASSSSDEGSDDGSSDDASSPAEKSFREQADNDETMGKAIDVSDFIEAMVDQISVSLNQLGDRMTKGLERIEQRINARIDNRVAKSMALSTNFNSRLGTAVAAIGNTIQDEVLDMVKSFANQPVVARPKALMSKSEVHQPPWSGGGGGDHHAAGSGGDLNDDLAALSEVPHEKIGEALFKGVAANKFHPHVILAWEADRYDVGTLPQDVQKALINDLIK